MRRADLGAIIALAALTVFLCATVLIEHLALDWHFAREIAPGDSSWHWMRAGIAATLSLWAVAAISAAGKGPPGGHAASSGALRLGWSVIAVAALLTIVLVVSPRAYRAMGAEDGLIEWLSAVALFLGGAFAILWHVSLFRSAPRAPLLHLVAAGGFAVVALLMAMEEISWGQRLIDYQTPGSVAASNWQGEFNLHNMHTDLVELALYTTTGVFLVILPLVRERLAHWSLLAPLAGLMPDRSVALVCAPMLGFSYARWELLPLQAVFFGGLACCAVYAWSARKAGRIGEAILFGAICLVLPVEQVIHLIEGHRMIYIHDATEFRELFLAIGIGWYAWRQWRDASRPAGASAMARGTAAVPADRLTGA